jgi:hypothetical protein
VRSDVCVDGIYGPTNRAFASLDESDARRLRADLEALWSAHNRGGDELTSCFIGVSATDRGESLKFWGLDTNLCTTRR